MQSKGALRTYTLPASSFDRIRAPHVAVGAVGARKLKSSYQAKDVLAVLLAWLLICFQNLHMYIISWETSVIYLDFVFLQITNPLILNQREFCFMLKLHYILFLSFWHTILHHWHPKSHLTQLKDWSESHLQEKNIMNDWLRLKNLDSRFRNELHL